MRPEGSKSAQKPLDNTTKSSGILETEIAPKTLEKYSEAEITDNHSQ